MLLYLMVVSYIVLARVISDLMFSDSWPYTMNVIRRRGGGSDRGV